MNWGRGFSLSEAVDLEIVLLRYVVRINATFVHDFTICALLYLGKHKRRQLYGSVNHSNEELSFILLLSQGPEEMCLSLEHENLSKTSEKNGLFWSRYSFVTHSIDRKPRD